MNRKIFSIILVALIAAGVGATLMISNATAPTAERPAINGQYNFIVEIDGITQAGFMEAEGLNATVEVIEYREGTEPTTLRLIPGLARYGPHACMHARNIIERITKSKPAVYRTKEA